MLSKLSKETGKMRCHRGSSCDKHLPALELGNEERELELLKLRSSEEEADLGKEDLSQLTQVSLRRQDEFGSAMLGTTQN